jgi:cytochrome c peroxidase
MRSNTLLFATCLTSAAIACSDSTTDAASEPNPETTEQLAPDEVGLGPKELLGKRIFEDKNLSEPRGQSCASCHDAGHAFSGNNGSSIPAVALGSRPNVFGNRNVPTAKYAKFSPPFSFVVETDEDGSLEQTPTGGQFWDGRAATLADQAKGPFLNVREMNNPDKGSVITKIHAGAYASLFQSVYGGAAFDDVDLAYDRAAEAVGAFEQTTRFSPFSSKFDDFLRGKAQLDPTEARGFELFKDPEKGNCIACHVGKPESHEPSDWLFTDFTFDNLGVPRNMNISDNADPSFFDIGLCKQEGIATKAPPGFDVETLCGAFKVPTLRNVEVSAPYAHNGYFNNLRDVVRFYVTRDTNPELWYPKDAQGVVLKFNDLPPQYRKNVNTGEVPYDRKPGESPRLTDDEIDAVVAFLKTLTDR